MTRKPNSQTSSQSTSGMSSDNLTEEQVAKICERQADRILEKINMKFEQMEINLNLYVKEVTETKNKIEVLEKKLDETEQYSRLNNLRVYGVEELEEENVEEVLIKLFKNKMKITISKDDIEKAHRLGPYNENTQRPIFVKFLSFKVRTAIYNEKKILKKTGFVIREDLTKYRLNLLKEAIKKYGKTNVWTASGKIFASNNNQKRIIKSILDIQ